MLQGWFGRAAIFILTMWLAGAGATVAIAQTEDATHLKKQTLELYQAGKYGEALAVAERWVQLVEHNNEAKVTAEALGNVAWYALLAKRPEKALAASERARKFAPQELWIETNRAHALLFLGRTQEARAIYLSHVGHFIGIQGKWETVIAKDFQEFRSRGLETPEMAVIGEALAKAASGPPVYELYDVATELRDQGKYAEAIPLMERLLAYNEVTFGVDDKSTLQSANNLALLYLQQGRNSEAEPLFRRALAGSEHLLGAEHPETLASVNNLALLYQALARYSEAEPLFRRALAVRERTLGAEHLDTLGSINNLAVLYNLQGRHSEAESLHRRALAARERVLGAENPDTLMSVANLAMACDDQGNYSQAEQLHRRALAGRERVLGVEHPDTLTSVNNLAALYDRQGRYGEAEPLYRRALAARERLLGAEHPDTINSVNNLAVLYETQGRHGEAEALHRRALAAQERGLGPEHPDTINSVSNLADLYDQLGRHSEAEPLHRRALAARERVLGVEHPETLISVNNLAMSYFAQRDWSRTAQLWRRSTAAISARTLRGALDTSHALTGKKKSDAEQWSWQFSGLVKAVYRLAPEGRPNAATSREMFQTAQWALSSEAAQSLAQMAARSAKGNGPPAKLVRERQDLVTKWQTLDAWRNAALGQEAAKRDAKAEAGNSEQLALTGARITGIDRRLAAEFPDYAALASPAPVRVEEVQAQLGADEALVLFLDTDNRFSAVAPEETFIWVVTKTDIRWVRSDLGTAALAREVQALRCGLDRDAWSGPHCANSAAGYTEADAAGGKPLPFDHARAHALYQALFGQVGDLIQGKHLLIVPSGPLTQLPFQVLVTASPSSGDHRSAAWLARDHALTILPAVSSLQALRRVARPTAATRPMIGFGNPLLDGDQKHPRFGENFKKLAQLARESQQCSSTTTWRVASPASWRGVTPVTGGGLADVSKIRIASPLPETADELCAVARDLNAQASDVHLGAGATEREVKRLSDNGQLAQYRIVHFATHGTLAGQLKGTSEPGLILTPPAEASAEDDGYLSASEIMGLKLDADWVILSACNTAAGDATGAQALSGIARAFIYAQARALLVSHWSVDSRATVKLITTAVREMASDSKLGRAEALRRGMLALIDKGEVHEAHPAYWAPFIVVGEGAR